MDAERRHRPPWAERIIVPCRHCWHSQALVPERVEFFDGRAWYRCRSCHTPYLIRWQDATALGAEPHKPV